MEAEYISLQPKNEVGLEQCSKEMSIDEAYIMGFYNDSISYLSLLNSEPLQQQDQNTQQHKWKQMKSSESGRKRRQKIAGKIKCLEKLLPWSTRMTTSAMLEEAAKYVEFLQAQICVLKSMPPLCPCCSSSSSCEKQVLNREELLAVMVNSPEIQTGLSKNGLCLCTAEQMASLLDNTMLWDY